MSGKRNANGGCLPLLLLSLGFAFVLYSSAWGIPYYEKPGSTFTSTNPFELRKYTVIAFDKGWVKYADETGTVHYRRSISLFFDPEYRR